MAQKYKLPENNLLDPKDKKWKIKWIKNSKRKNHPYIDIARCTNSQLNRIIGEIVQDLIIESEIIAKAYINGYR